MLEQLYSVDAALLYKSGKLVRDIHHPVSAAIDKLRLNDGMVVPSSMEDVAQQD
jgi:hypothetical protein